MAKYLGDIAEDTTINFKFHTVNLSAVPITLADTAVIEVDKDNATGTETATVITTGTVDSVSVVGAVVAEFSIENRFNTDISALALEASLFDYTSNSVTVGAMDTTALVDFVANDTGETAGVAGSVVQIAASDTWEEAISDHNTAGSLGKSIRNITDVVISDGTAQSAANDYSIILDAAEPATAGLYDPARIVIVDGTGEGQSRLIYEYSIDGASRMAIVDRDWKTRPDNTSEYIILADAGRESVNEGLARDGGASTITLNALAASDNNTYLHQSIMIRAGVGADQTAIVTAYNGTSKVATVTPAWVVQPTAESVYNMQPSGPSALISGAISASTFVTDAIDANALAVSALAEFVTVDTSESSAAAGSVALLSQSGGGEVTVGDITATALAKFSDTDTGETTPVSGSVAKLAQGVGTSGAGADQVTINIKVSGNNLPDASVWCTSDSAGNVVIAGTLTTDSNGDVLFLLDADSTYYLWAIKAGYVLPQGESFVAVAD